MKKVIAILLALVVFVLFWALKKPLTNLVSKVLFRLLNLKKQWISKEKLNHALVPCHSVFALLGAYIDVTGNDATPLVMGGGTYARKFPNAVAFGPGFPGTPNPAGAGKGGAHQIDECICIENMWKALKVYIAALLNLNELEL